MKIINFIGVKINEYIDIDINFNEDLSILIGTNGSGKTTALNLIHSLLCPKLDDLIIVPFDKLELQIEHLKNVYIISASKNKKSLTLSIKNISEKLIIENANYEEFEFLNYTNKDEISVSDLLLKKYNNHPVISFIKDLPSPIFIGLERTNLEVKDDYKNYLIERNIFLTKKPREIERYRRSVKGTLGISILDTELLIQSIYKRLKAVEDRYSNSIQKQLIYSSFEYIDFDINSLPTNVSFSEKSILLSRRSEIEESLRKIGLTDKDLSDKIKTFFNNLDGLFRLVAENDEKTPGVTIEWLLNKSQIDKLTKLVEILDEYNSKVKETFSPITKFLDIINSFFKDTSKKVSVDEVGRLYVKKPNGRDLTIDELSSGERQLIIIFANVIFNKYSPSSHKNETLIIDEPEISLHIRWQEKFITSLYEASEKTQFIVATHSPDIIGDYKHKAIRLAQK
jgi:predicted ATP-binding protein involved in virulence